MPILRAIIVILSVLGVISPHLRGEIRVLAVTTSAGFVPGLPGPGSPATIFCTGLNIGLGAGIIGLGLPVDVQGITVTYADSFRAPIYGVADLGTYQVVNFQVPWEDHPGPIVLAQGESSVVVPSAVAPWGEFFTDADGFAIAAHAADFSLVTAASPIQPGEWIVLYASNLGSVNGPPPSGQPASLTALAPLDPGMPVAWNFEVLMRNPAGDLPLESNFMGLAPGLIGAYQVNAKMPDALPSGAVQIYLQRSRFCGFFFVPGCGRGEMMDTSTIAKLR